MAEARLARANVTEAGTAQAGVGLGGAVEAIGRQRWLDALGEPLQRGVTDAFAAGGSVGRQVKNFLHGTWLGHPLHPALTDVPVGAWTAALVLDGLESIGGRKDVGPGADAAVAVGLAGAVGAALAGLADWQHTGGESRRTGLVHGLLNVGAAALYTTSLLMRRRGARAAGRRLASAGYAVAFASTYLGGDLVYRQRIGVNHAAAPLPDDFVPVLADADLPEGEPRRAHAGGTPVLLVRRNGRIHALAETCAHLGGPLAEGRLVDGSVVCPWHGSRFDLEDGRVLDGPATYPQPCLETRVRDGRIEVRASRRQRLAAPASAGATAGPSIR